MAARILTALVGIPLALWLVFTPIAVPFDGGPLWLAITLLTLLGMHEFYAACRRAGAMPYALAGYLAAVTLALNALRHGDGIFVWILRPAANVNLLEWIISLLVVLSCVAILARPAERRAPLRDLGATWLAVAWIAWLFPYVAAVRMDGDLLLQAIGWSREPLAGWMRGFAGGAWLLAAVLFVTWANDSAAMLGGKAFGRHKMAPLLSPGKTWEGTFCGTAAGVLAGVAMGAWLHWPPLLGGAVGILCSVLGPLGDLTESALKRELGIKDFGALLPGHGGVLDRFDSLLFNAVAAYYLVAFWPS